MKAFVAVSDGFLILCADWHFFPRHAPMSSLAELPNLVGFFSYSREDDEGSDGKLSKLRMRVQEELRAQLGRTKKDFSLFQDQAAIFWRPVGGRNQVGRRPVSVFHSHHHAYRRQKLVLQN